MSPVGVDALEHHRPVAHVPVEQQHAAGRVHPRLVPAAALDVPRAEAVPDDAAVAAPVLGQGPGAVEVGDRVPADAVPSASCTSHSPSQKSKACAIASVTPFAVVMC